MTLGLVINADEWDGRGGGIELEIIVDAAVVVVLENFPTSPLPLSSGSLGAVLVGG